MLMQTGSIRYCSARVRGALMVRNAVTRQLGKGESVKRLVARAAAIAAALVLVSSSAAFAGEWSWSGSLYPNAGGRDGSCIWYPNTSSCAGWNYWHWTSGAVLSGPYVKYLTGYENNERIRGIWLYNGQNGGTWVSGVDMSGYLKAVATYWEGAGTYYWAYAQT